MCLVTIKTGFQIRKNFHNSNIKLLWHLFKFKKKTNLFHLHKGFRHQMKSIKTFKLSMEDNLNNPSLSANTSLPITTFQNTTITNLIILVIENPIYFTQQSFHRTFQTLSQSSIMDKSTNPNIAFSPYYYSNDSSILDYDIALAEFAYYYIGIRWLLMKF